MHHFPVKKPITLDWSEMDLFGHINNVSYFKYVQASRVHYWELTGLAATFPVTRIGPVLLSTGCQFMQPLFYPGNIEVESRVEFMKNTSFGIHHRILNAAKEICAEAHDVIVMFDFNTNQKVPIPLEFRDKVKVLQGE